MRHVISYSWKSQRTCWQKYSLFPTSIPLHFSKHLPTIPPPFPQNKKKNLSWRYSLDVFVDLCHQTTSPQLNSFICVSRWSDWIWSESEEVGGLHHWRWHAWRRTGKTIYTTKKWFTARNRYLRKVWDILSTWHATTFASTDLTWVVWKHHRSALFWYWDLDQSNQNKNLHSKINVINHVKQDVLQNRLQPSENLYPCKNNHQNQKVQPPPGSLSIPQQLTQVFTLFLPTLKAHGKLLVVPHFLGLKCYETRVKKHTFTVIMPSHDRKDW